MSNIKKRQVIITTCESTAFNEVDDVNFVYINNGRLCEAPNTDDEMIETENIEE